MRVLVVNAEAFNGFESRSLALARELIERGHRVVHAGPADTMRDRGFGLTTFDPTFAETAEAQAARTRLFSSWDELAGLVDWCQVLLMGIGKSYEAITAYATTEGKVVLWHRDIGSDHLWITDADRVAARGRFEIPALAAHAGLPPDRIVVTGCVQFDAAAPHRGRLDKAAFCRKYGLDESKRTAAFLATGPAGHAENVKANYRRICAAVLGVAGFNLIIKPHPREFARSKQDTTYADAETPTWVQLAPGVPACAPCDTYDCFRHCDVLLTQNSDVFKEGALLHKPILEVAIPEARAHHLGIPAQELTRLLPRQRFTPPGRKPWTRLGCLERAPHLLAAGSVRDNALKLIEDFRRLYDGHTPDFIGSECSLDELGDVLGSGAYAFDDDDAYDTYVSEYCFANDGLAYKRVADFVEAVERDPQLAPKLRRTQGVGRLRGYAKRQARTVRRLLKAARRLRSADDRSP